MIGIVVKGAIGLAAIGGIGAAVVAAVTPSVAASEQAVVTHLVNGDTFDVSIGGRSERIRMLNIDTPETKDPNEDVQCLGPEAAAFLASLIPVGTTVTLEYDEERIDPYGRTLAGVFAHEGTLVNAEVARAGLATAVVFGENDRFLAPVQEAQQDAAAQRRGLYSADIACTLPAQLDAVVNAVAAAPTAASQPTGASSVELDTAADNAATAVVTAAVLRNAFAGPRVGLVWAAFTREEQERFASRAAAAWETAGREETALRTAATSAQTSEAEQARVAAEQAEAARVAEERRKAAEAEARRKPTTPARPDTPAKPNPPVAKSKPAPAPAPDANPYPGYTGPRCYAPGGKTWKPC